ncbi:hypothetical protein DPMN_104745 [Dreissena polymorpha]|uniref:Uncharacterized protein n=1 Tax=Dreissena polymorpha TaxID=45954 RepID=A0A9D4HCK5_DREPO|nr:hypothetical protein DPMN_104745 [Dreissena polymorpha]
MTSNLFIRANRQEADDAASRDLSSMPCSATPLSGLTRYRCSQSRANRQEADAAASRDLSSMPCSATPLVAIVDGSEWADKIQMQPEQGE